MKPNKQPDKTIAFPIDKLKDLLIAHLYATSYLNDDQEVKDLVFKTGVDIKNTIKFDIFLKNTKNKPDLSVIDDRPLGDL
jgi:hypothetical protein